MTDTNMTAHTPGPWRRGKYGDLTGSNGRKVQMADSGMAFVSAYENPEAVANTALCHAAPELLEALTVARGWHQGDKWRASVMPGQQAKWQEQMDRINSAIAKATGAPA